MYIITETMFKSVKQQCESKSVPREETKDEALSALGFNIQDSRFRISRFKIQGSRFKVQNSRFKIWLQKAAVACPIAPRSPGLLTTMWQSYDNYPDCTCLVAQLNLLTLCLVIRALKACYILLLCLLVLPL